MQRYRYEIDNVRSHLRSLWAVIGLQLLVILGLWIGWMRMPSNITVHIPPDLRSGAVMALHDGLWQSYCCGRWPSCRCGQ